MSARNMVRNLRDNGDLEAISPHRPRTRAVLFIVFALGFGAIAYLGAVYGVPVLIKLVEKKPAPVHYAKPGVGG